jgi:hypothetical protein
VKLFKVQAPIDGVILQVFAVDGAGLPTGTALGASTTIPNGSITGTTTATANVVTATFTTPVALAANTKYAMVFIRSGATDGTNYWRACGSSSSTYTGGVTCYYNGTAWFVSPGSYDYYMTIGGAGDGSATETYYLFGFDDIGGSGGDGRRLVTLKADDPSSEWTVINSLPTTGNTPIKELAGYQVGGVVHILLSQSGAPTINDVRYCKWDSATDSWSVNNETVVTNVSMVGTGIAQSNGVSLVVRSTGEVVAFYNGASSNTSGKPYCRLYYNRRSTAGAWGTAVRVDANTAVDNIKPAAVLGASDRVHFIWSPTSAGNSQQHRALTAANALGTAAVVTTATPGSQWGAGSYSTGGVTYICLMMYSTLIYATSADTPTWANTAVTNPQSVGVTTDPYFDGTDIWLLYVTTSTYDVYVSKSANRATIANPATLAMTAQVPLAATSLSKNGAIYQRDSNVVIPYVANDNGTWKYNEYLVRVVTQADAWSAADKTTGCDLSDNDKTATATTAGARAVRSTTQNLNGLYYAEFKINTGTDFNLGMKSAGQSLADQSTGFSVYTSSGTIRNNTTSVGNIGGACAVGDVVCVAWNSASGKAWMRKNNGLWNNNAAADPATDANGLTCTSFGHLWFYSGVAGASATVRTELAELQYQGPSGYSTWMGEVLPTADAWNVNDKTANITLSNGDKTATCSSVGASGIRSTTAHGSTAGKLYLEMVLHAGGPVLGLKGTVTGTVSNQSSNYVGCYTPTGQVNINYGSNLATLGAFAAGDVLSIAWDANAKLIWFRRNNDTWSKGGDPAAGLFGIDTSALPDPLNAAWMGVNAVGNSVTVRTEKDEFTQTTPAGFLSWMGETLVIPDMGTLVSDAATIAGVGNVEWAGTGNLVPQPSTVIGLAASRSTGTGALVAVGYTRTNLLARSQEFDMWAAENALRTGNTTTAPDSTLTADTLSDGLATGTHYLYQQNLPATSGANYTFSVYLKAGTLNWAQVMLITPSVRWANFDLSTGALGQKESAAVTATRTYVGDGWWRCSVTAAVQAGTIYTGGFIALKQADVVFSQQHIGTNATFYAWGAQLERGDVATAYIPTTTAAVTISETLIGTGTVSWNATGGLVAGAHSNYIWPSQDFEKVEWARMEVSVSADAVAAPDKMMTADVVVAASTNNYHGIYLNNALLNVPDGIITTSIYFRAYTSSWIQINDNLNWANFNVNIGTIGNKSETVNAVISDAGGGWYRCSITYQRPTSVRPQLFLLLGDQNVAGGNVYTGSGQAITYWGAQVEDRGAPTAYLLTTTAPVSYGAPSTLTGAGVVTTPPAYGTGALTTGLAGLAGLGISSSVGTAPLVAAGKTRINYFLYSQQFDIGTWTKAASVITAENAVAPDNTLTADLLTDTIASANHYMMQSGVGYTIPVGTNTYSIYVKPKTLTWIQLRVSDTDTFWANFNIVTGAKGLDSANGLTTVIAPVGNGWYRCSVTFPHPQTNWNANCFVIMQVADEPISSFVGTGLSAWLWGAQFESSGQATAYIPTIGSVVSVTDVLTGVGLINNTGTGVLVVTQLATLSGEGSIQWNATGVLASYPAIVVGAGKAVDPPTTGTGVLISLGVAAVAGVGVSRSVGEGGAYFALHGGTKNQNIWGRTAGSGTGQSFISVGSVITDVTVYLGKVGTPVDNFVGQIWTEGSANLPGTLLATATVPGITPSTSNSEEITFVFSTPVAVVKGTKYIFTTTRSGATSTTDYYTSGYSSLNLYASGQFITRDASGVWGTASGAPFDLWIAINQSLVKGAAASRATLSGPGGFVEYIATGALVNNPVVIESIGSVVDGPAHGTGALVTLDVARVAGVAISGSVGAPNLQPSNSAASGAGVTKVDGNAVLASSNAVVNSVGLVRDIIKGPGVLTAGASALTASGTALTPAKGDGVLVVTDTAIVTGSGIVEWNVTGTGILTNGQFAVSAQGKSETRGTGALTSTSTIVGGGFIRWIVTGALVQSRPTVTAPGVSRSIGSGAFVVSNTAAVSGLGSVFSGVSGIGTLTSFATLSAIGRSESNGLIGTLPSSAASVTGVSTSLSSGAAVLSNSPSVLAASGKSIFIATGTLVDQSAIISGVGSARWMMSGTLPASAATLTALGASRWTGTGTLISASAAATGSGFSQAIGTGALPAAPATLVSFEGVTVISGTGALQVGASAVAGVGYPRWLATGALVATASTLTGSGIVIPKTVGAGDLVALTSAMAGVGGSIWRMSGALVSAPAVVAATGIGATQGTAPLLAARSTVYGYEGVSVITGTGALQSQSYLATGLGFSRTSGAGTLTEAPFGVVGEGLSQSTGAGVLLDVQSALNGTGLSATGGLGVLGSMATVNGSGQAQWLGSGVLTSDIAGLVAAAISGSRGVATLGVGLSTLSAVGQSDVRGTAALTSSSAIITGFANLVASGAGVLVTEDYVLQGAGLQFASGWGQLYAYRFEIEGIGQTWNTGFGNLISHYPALMLGRGAVSSNAIGVLQSGPAKIVGGSVQTIGLGVLLAQRSTISGVGYVETVTPPVEGEWVPTPLPPSYHGVASWGGASMVRPWVNPGIQPWRRVG